MTLILINDLFISTKLLICEGEFKVGPLKTENSYRTLGMNETVFQLLKQVKENQDKMKK